MLERQTKNQLLYESLLVYLSVQVKALRTEDAVYLFEIISWSPSLSQMKTLSSPAQNLVKGLVTQYLPILIQTVGRMELTNPAHLISILRYYTELSISTRNPISTTYLEILSLQLIRMKQNMTDEQFLTCYTWFADLDLKSTAFSDHFNKFFETVVELDLAWTPKVYHLSGEAPTTPKDKGSSPIAGMQGQDLSVSLVESKFTACLDYVWSFFKFSFRSGDLKHIDLSLLKQMIKLLNGLVHSDTNSQIAFMPKSSVIHLDVLQKTKLQQIEAMCQFLKLKPKERLTFSKLNILNIKWEFKDQRFSQESLLPSTSDQNLHEQFNRLQESLGPDNIIEDFNLPFSFAIPLEEMEAVGVVPVYDQFRPVRHLSDTVTVAFQQGAARIPSVPNDNNNFY